MLADELRHDVGQLGPAVLLEEMPGALDRRRGACPARAGHVRLQHLRPAAGGGIAVGERGEERAVERRPARAWCGGSAAAHALPGVRPISSGSWRGPAQKVSSGNGAS